MARKHKTQTLGTVLGGVIDSLGLRTRINEARVVEGWAILAGPQINAVTHSAWVKDGKLYVKITSAAWRQELHLQRQAWRKHLNEHLGASLVRDIVFR